MREANSASRELAKFGRTKHRDVVWLHGELKKMHGKHHSSLQPLPHMNL
jgi:hypothetical protein